MNTFSEPCVGIDDGPPSASAYKRAVYKQAPASFAVELLPPQKQGNNYSYGMRIIPLKAEDSSRQSVVSGVSEASGNSSSGDSTSSFGTEYEVWRRWEDCLYFQDLLESQYAQMAREKRARLQAGKGVKKNGVYPHEDPLRHVRAASFESLPPGPDPHLIAKDVHEFLPKLTKKGTLFRASQQTIEQRAQEFARLIQALLRDGEDVPTLIVELRQLRVVRDFFGFWRRDFDRVRKEEEKDGKGRARTDSMADMMSVRSMSSARNSSVFGSSFGMYFSASNLSLQLPTPLALPPDMPFPEKRVRRPPEMAEKLAGMVAIPPSSPLSATGNVASGSGQGSSRQRAQTLQATTSKAPEASTSRVRAESTSASLSAPVQPSSEERPPASAPAGIGFKFTMHSDDGGRAREADGRSATSATESTHSPKPDHTSQAPKRPPRAAARQSANVSTPSVPVSARSSEVSFSSTKFKGPDLVIPEPSDDDLLDVPVDEQLYDDVDMEEHIMVLREHEHLLPYSPDAISEPSVADFGFGLRRRLQDLTIEEEDDDDEGTQEGGTVHEHEHEHSSNRIRVSDGSQGVILPPGNEEPIVLLPPIPRTPRIRESSLESHTPNRNGFIFLPHEEDDSFSLIDRNSVSERSRSPQSAAARADALTALTKKGPVGARVRSPSPSSARLLTPSGSSVRTSGSSGSAPSFETQTSVGSHAQSLRPESIQSSNSSYIDYDGRLSVSSPMTLHTPLFEEAEHSKGEQVVKASGEGLSTAGLSPSRPEFVRSHRSNDSVASMRSVMTDCSADAIIPRRAMSPPPPSPTPRRVEGNLRRSMSTGSREPRRSRKSGSSGATDQPWQEDGDDLVEAYFGDVTAITSEDSIAYGASRSRERIRSTLVPADNFSRPFPNRPPTSQFPWTPNTLGNNSPRNSILSTADSVSPSIAGSLFGDEASAVSIKAVFGDHIVAFRVERTISLSAVRAKLFDKFVNQQNVRLSDSFTLTYRPSAIGRPQHNMGRSRSNSVSSMGRHDPNQLRIIFSQKEWQDAMMSCGPKFTLHVLNSS